MKETIEVDETAAMSDPRLLKQVSDTLESFTSWLEAYGEVSRDHQTLFAGTIGGGAKSLYYRHKLLGTAAVAPLIFFEAFLPSMRHLFHHPTRFPIADAHYAMGFAFLCKATGRVEYAERAVHFLDELKGSRSPGYAEYCWGYPFDWVTRGGVIAEQIPLITSTPYAYEAFLQVINLIEDANFASGFSTHLLELPREGKQILLSIARHAANDITDSQTSAAGSSCSYSPFHGGAVINAAAYRAFLLTNAALLFSIDEYRRIADRNLAFVLENQKADGSWPYAVDGVRDFVDHFHTCFVMKALAKIHTLTGHTATREALSRGLNYYLENLFEADGLPRPFAKAPRLTVYKRELYDCAECINLCLLLRDRFPRLETTLQIVVKGILKDWVKPDGSFRSRRLMLGWDNVPMHRWAQSQMFRSLAFYLHEALESGHKKARLPVQSVLNSQPL